MRCFFPRVVCEAEDEGEKEDIVRDRYDEALAKWPNIPILDS
jgi:hypothetical protein